MCIRDRTLDYTFDRLNLIVFVLIISASLLAFVVLYNLTNINITERVREIATIKVLGFYDREVDAYIFRENIICLLYTSDIIIAKISPVCQFYFFKKVLDLS